MVGGQEAYTSGKAVWNGCPTRVRQLCEARRETSALSASSYLRRLSGDVPFLLAVITEEIDVLLLSPPQLDHLTER